MPNWKKVIVSGSDAALNSLYVTNDVTIEGNLTVTGSFKSSGSISFKTYRLTSSFYTASLDDYRIGIKYTNTGSVFIQLPLITNTGEIEYKFKDEEGNAYTNNITLITSGSDTIDGSSTAILNRDYIAIGLYNDGVSKWYIE